MKWQRALRQFGLRFAISLVILGGVYLAIFGWPVHHKRALTAVDKIAALRAKLDESYIYGNTLANFSESSVVAYNDLLQLTSAFSDASSSLATGLKTAPGTVSPSLKTAIQSQIGVQQQAEASFKAISTVLSHVASYDPSTDLGAPALASDMTKIASRASAAQNGLKTAANSQASAANTSAGSSSSLSVGSDNNSLLVSADTRQALLTEADCFGTVASQATAKQKDQTSNTIKRCVAAYPSVLKQVIQNIVQLSFGGSYQQTTQQTVPDLLKQLNKLIED